MELREGQWGPSGTFDGKNLVRSRGILIEDREMGDEADRSIGLRGGAVQDSTSPVQCAVIESFAQARVTRGELAPSCTNSIQCRCGIGIEDRHMAHLSTW